MAPLLKSASDRDRGYGKRSIQRPGFLQITCSQGLDQDPPMNITFVLFSMPVYTCDVGDWKSPNVAEEGQRSEMMVRLSKGERCSREITLGSHGKQGC